jgi:hypothetical protein
MKKRYKEAYKKAFILEIKKITGNRISVDSNHTALQKAFVIFSKQEMLKILCEMFGISWKSLIQFQLSNNYFYFSFWWINNNFNDILERIKQDINNQHRIYPVNTYAFLPTEFEFIKSLI